MPVEPAERGVVVQFDPPASKWGNLLALSLPFGSGQNLDAHRDFQSSAIFNDFPNCHNADFIVIVSHHFVTVWLGRVVTGKSKADDNVIDFVISAC